MNSKLTKSLENFESNFEFFVNFEFIFELFVISSFFFNGRLTHYFIAIIVFIHKEKYTKG